MSLTHGFDWDLLVIGAGSGGVRAARMAAQRGVRVAVAEAGALGGTCVNLGCIPKKLYSYAAHYADSFAEAAGYGWQLPGRPTLDWELLKANRRQEISRLNAVYDKLLVGSGVTVLRGWAQVTGPHSVVLNGQTHTAQRLLVATGGQAQMPAVSGIEWAVTSDDMFDLNPFPKRLLVVGGGYIATEFASIFNGLGSDVHQICRGEKLLRGFDEDVRDFIGQEIGKAGVHLQLQAGVQRIDKTDAGLNVVLTDGQVLQVDTVLYATGREPKVGELGLESAGVALRKDGAVLVNEAYQTSVPSIYALGDVTGRLQLTPVAIGEAMALVDQLYGAGLRKMDYDAVPTAVFTHPNIGTVGLSESDARDKFGNIVVFKTDFKALKHTLSGSQERTFVKLVVDGASDRVVGLHMVGPDAGEIVQGFAVAIKAGATKAVFDSTVGIHPTLAEEFVTLRTPFVG